MLRKYDTMLMIQMKGLRLKNTANLHPSQREHAVEFILARLDWCRVHESIIELK